MGDLRLLAATLAVAAVWPGAAHAGPMLTGQVTYDPAARLYTYAYTLDDRAAPAPVDLVSVRVATHVYDLSHRNPVGYTAPAPFTDFYTSEGGWDTAALAGGTFYNWDADRPVAGRPLTAGVHGGFSFTSRYGPGAGNAPDYILYSHALGGPPVTGLEIGRVVAPDLTHTPEPGTMALAAIGLAAVGVPGLRRCGKPGGATSG
jgi:hypothetical protein